MEEPQSITTRLHGVSSQVSVFFMKAVVVQFLGFPSYFGPLGPGVIFGCQCRLWCYSNGTVVQFLPGAEIFAFYQYSLWLWGQPSYISSSKAEQGSEANHTRLSNAKAKNAWSYISAPPIFPDTPSLCSERKLHSRGKRKVEVLCLFIHMFYSKLIDICF